MQITFISLKKLVEERSIICFMVDPVGATVKTRFLQSGLLGSSKTLPKSLAVLVGKLL